MLKKYPQSVNMNRLEKSLTSTLSGFLLLFALVIATGMGAEISPSDTGVMILFSLFLIVMGIVLYFITPEDKRRPRICPQCGKENPSDAKYCERCGFFQY